MLCLFSLLAMHSGAEHLGGMHLLAAASSISTTGHVGDTAPAAPGHDPTHASGSGHHHDHHLMVMCLLVVTTVATVLARRWRSAGLAAVSTPSGVPRRFAGFDERPSPSPAWPHDRLCILLR